MESYVESALLQTCNRQPSMVKELSYLRSG